MTGQQPGAFWDDLARDLQDPAFAHQYAIESARIATIDAVLNSLDAAREAEGLSKADLARAIGSEPAAIRRLFGSGRVNPTLGTLAEVAAALGLRITVESASTGSSGKAPTRGGGRRAAPRPTEPVRIAAAARTAPRSATKTKVKRVAG